MNKEEVTKKYILLKPITKKLKYLLSMLKKHERYHSQGAQSTRRLYIQA